MPAKRKSIEAAKHLEKWKVGADRNLDISDRDVPWDPAAAKKRIFTWAGFDGDSPDSTKARKVFLVYDSAHADLKGSYKLPFADIRDGKPVVIRAAIRNAASRLPQTDIPQDVKDRARKIIDQYLEKFRGRTNALADLPSEFFMTAESSDLEILAGEHDEDEDGKPRIRKFRMRAYSGGQLFLANFPFPVVVDLQGLKIPKSKRPILRDHRLDQVVGHTESIAIQSNKLQVAGMISGANDHAQEIIDSSDNGFPWQSSIGAKANKIEFVDEGEKIEVNGRNFVGPLYVATRSALGEISFVALGADEHDTPARVAATKRVEVPMNEFEKWLKAKGIDPNELTDEVKATLEDAFDEQEKAKIEAAKTATAADDPKSIEGKGKDPIVELRAGMAAEALRVSAVQKLCGDHSEILATAIADNWDVTKTELAVRNIELKALRESRPAGPSIHAHAGKSINGKAMEAALCLSGGMDEQIVGKSYDEKTMEAALSTDLRGAGIHALFYEVIMASGGHCRLGVFNDSTIKAAFRAEQQIQIRATGGDFSTVSIADILSNVANKTLLNSFLAVESIVSQLSHEKDVKDFKQSSSYRLTSTGRLEKVAPDGELTHSTLTDEKFTNQLDTYGRILALTRQTIINDDLDSFLAIPRMLGRQGALARERIWFELLLANAGPFFVAGNKNLITGAGTNLQISSLSDLEQLFLDQVDSDDQPILVLPKFLLVPTKLKVTGKQLTTDQFVNETTTTDKPKPASNPHAGKWELLSSPYMNAQGLPSQSDTAWYFFANPADIAAVEISYLNGLRTPTMDTSEMNFNLLGMQWRAFWDFGIALQDHRGAAKSVGA